MKIEEVKVNWQLLRINIHTALLNFMIYLSLEDEFSKEFDQFEALEVFSLFLLEDLSELSFITSNSFSQLLDFEPLPPNPSKNASSSLLFVDEYALSFLLLDPYDDLQSLK